MMTLSVDMVSTDTILSSGGSAVTRRLVLVVKLWVVVAMLT